MHAESSQLVKANLFIAPQSMSVVYASDCLNVARF
jgi:hypothetical protein